MAAKVVIARSGATKQSRRNAFESTGPFGSIRSLTALPPGPRLTSQAGPPVSWRGRRADSRPATGEAFMNIARLGRVLAAAALAAFLVAPQPGRADDANKTLKIGVVYDLTGPFAGGGSELHYLGAKIMIDWINQHGGVEGHKIEPVYADAQSKPDVAINEAVRLIEQEHVDMLLGFYSSAECVPAAARIEQFKKFMWITTCIASPVLEGRNLQYVFRPQPYGQQWGHASTEMVANYSKAQLGKEPKDVKIAILHEDGAYGTDVARGTVEGA